MTSTTTIMSPSHHYVYHWERIIPAVAVPLIGIGALTWWLLSSHHTTDAVSQTAVPQTTVVVAPAAVIPTPAPEVKPQAAQTAPVVAANLAPEKPVAVAAAVPAPVKEAKPKEAPVSARAPEVKSTIQPVAPSAGIKPGQIRVTGEAVSHVTLQQVLDEEPVEIAKGTIYLSQNKAVKVVFSADMNKPGDAVHYRWYHDGKDAAKVVTHVSPESKTRSSKFISFDAPGEWQVQMIDKHGKVLAETAFVAKVR